MKPALIVEDAVIRKTNETMLLSFLDASIESAARAEASSYYPKGSILAIMPSAKDLEKARNAVIEQALATNFESLVPSDHDMRPYVDNKDKLHRVFLAEAIAHIDEHKEGIGRLFFEGVTPTCITNLSFDGADCHCGSRHTMVIETDAGKFLYKPHTLKPDVVVSELCDELFPGKLCIPKAIDCDTFGFSEFIKAKKPSNAEELEGFYSGLGLFCALAYFVSLSDQHAENMIPFGSKVALIDLETILASSFKEGVKTWHEPPDSFSGKTRRSVFRTGMLGCARGAVWGSILTGTLHEHQQVGGNPESIAYRDAIVSGFEHGYRVCLKNKDVIKSKLQELEGARLRVLLENTQYYFFLQRRTFNASSWKAGGSVQAVDRALSSAKRSLLSANTLKSEYNDVLNGDFPCFFFTPDGRDLCDVNGVVEKEYLSASPLSLAFEHIDSADEDDLEFQTTLLKKAIDDMPRANDDNPAGIEEGDVPLSMEEARAEAHKLLEQLYEDLVPCPDGSFGIWGTHYGETHRSSMGTGLGTGYAGVGVFAAACLAAGAGEPDRVKIIIDTCLHEISCYAKDYKERIKVFPRADLGLSGGLGGILRSLQLMWEYTQDSRIPDIYAELLSCIELLDYGKCAGSNIYNGLAGLLYAASHHIPGLPQCTEIAGLADELLSRGKLNEEGFRIWTEADGNCGSIGYGKGNGGIGLAFLLAWQITHDRRYWDACCNAIGYEDASFDEKLGFYPLKNIGKGKKVCGPGICRGLPGQSIVFTLASQFDVPLAKRNVERARNYLPTLAPEINDNLCCGSTAIAEGLIVLGCTRDAGCLLARQLKRKNKNGFYVTENTKRAPYYNPTLFFGCLGVGYELLRYMNPELIKSLFM